MSMCVVSPTNRLEVVTPHPPQVCVNSPAQVVHHLEISLQYLAIWRSNMNSCFTKQSYSVNKKL